MLLEIDSVIAREAPSPFMRPFLSSAFLSVIALLVACGKNPDTSRQVSGRQPSGAAIAVQSSPVQTSSPKPVERENSAPIEEEKTESTSAPPSTFKDEGACPFEGCIYRQWRTEKATAIHEQADDGSPVVFSLKPGEWVTAITSFVVTEPGIFEFKQDGKTDESASRFSKGAKVYLYTSYGEGGYKAWFNGKFINFDLPGANDGEIVKEPKETWWVHLRNSNNQEGWTSEGRFSNTDQLGGPDLSPSATISQ
jgi:hypothetical protein